MAKLQSDGIWESIQTLKRDDFQRHRVGETQTIGDIMKMSGGQVNEYAIYKRKIFKTQRNMG